VKFRTRRFRGNVIDAAARAMAIRIGTRSAADPDVHPKRDDA
jgi:hypothetical protein